jgi:hypothetical protein
MGPYVLSHELKVLAERYPAGASALDALKVDIINVCNQIKPSNCPQLATKSSPMIIHPGRVENGAGGEATVNADESQSMGQAAAGAPDPDDPDNEHFKPTQAQLAQFKKQCQMHGPESLIKSRASLKARYDQHINKIAIAKENGGYYSSMERENANFQQQINAIDQVLQTCQ